MIAMPDPTIPTNAPGVPDYTALLKYEPRSNSMANCVLLVTGAADGIGRSVAKACARLGARIVAIDRNRKGLTALRDEIVESGGTEPDLHHVDLAAVTITGLREIAGAIEDRHGVLDGLLNNAGWIGALSPFEHCEPATFMKVMNVNLAAPFFLTQWCIPLLRRSRAPVLGFSLHAASRAYWGGYALAKAGQEALLGVVADEYTLGGTQPIRVFGVDPGPVMTADRRLHFPGEAPGMHPTSEDVTGPYLFALGPDAPAISPLILRSPTSGRVA